MKLLLVDLSGIFRAFWHASENDEVSAAFQKTVGLVTKIREGYDRVAICCDSPPYNRRAISAEYKANRSPMPPLFYEQQDKVKERLRKDGAALLEAPGYEADDVIATAVVKASVGSITIASGDKDLLQLVQDGIGVDVLVPLTGARMNEAAVVARWGVHPRDFGDFLALMGDKSDNIPGIPGVGEKKAAQLLAEWGTLEGVLTHTSDMPDSKLREAIIVGSEACRLGRRLIELQTDAPVNIELLYAEPKLEPLGKPSPDLDLDEDDVPEISDPPLSPNQQIEAQLAGTVQGVRGLSNSAIMIPKPTAIAPVPFELGLEPQSPKQAMQLAEWLFESRLYTRFKNKEAIFAAIVRGREMGIGALTSLDVIHIIEGKPAIHAHLVASKAKEHPDCEYFQLVSSSDTEATYETKNKRNPEVTRHTYRMSDAQRAGVAPLAPRSEPVWKEYDGRKKDVRTNWEKRPAEMLRKTCAVQLARAEYPSAALGLYAIEELEE